MPSPIKLGEVLAELILRRGYAREQSRVMLGEAWLTAVGERWGTYTRVGNLQRGLLEITVSNSALVQELTFRKVELLETLRKSLPEEKIRDLRFRVGPLGTEKT